MPTERSTRLSLVLNWVGRHERRLSSLVFIGGFVSDLLTFTLLNVSLVNKLFIVYISLAILFSLIGHISLNKGREGVSKFVRFLQVASPLIAQFFIGGLLSGFLIFYTKSSTVLFSWPFILLLVLVFIGNEVFSSYRTHLTFQTTLLYFSAYAYAIFAVPLVLNTLSTKTFLIATGVSVVGLFVYCFFLAMLGWNRLREVIVQTLGFCALITSVVVIAYVGNVIPPIPLTLKEVGVYQSVTRTGEGYVLLGEKTAPWYSLRARTVHTDTNASLSAYSAVFAPGEFSVSIAHEWQYYNPQTKTWERKALIAFPVSGGREEGYRGYSTKGALIPGKWRVLVKTINGQTLGDLSFTVIEGVPREEVTKIR